MTRAESHRDQSRREGRRALVRWAEHLGELEQRGGGAPRVGDRFFFTATVDMPVEWVVIEHDPARRRPFLVVATDTHSLTGGADVKVPAGAAGGPLNVRSELEVRLPAEAFDPRLRIGSLDPGVVDLVLRKRREMAQGRLIKTPEEREVESFPEYQDWRSSVLIQAQAALADSAGGGILSFPASPRWRRMGQVAAAVFVVSTMAGGWLWQQRRIESLESRLKTARLEQPVSRSPMVWLNTLQESRGDSIPITLPATAEHVLLILDVNDPSPSPSYRLELGDPGSDSAWSSGELSHSGIEEIGLVVPRRLLPAGTHPLRIYAANEGDEGDSELAAQYTLEVRWETRTAAP